MFGNLFGDFEKRQAEIKAKLATVEVMTEVSGITVTASGNRRIVNISIDPEKVDTSDKEMLEDVLVEAVNRALEEAEIREAALMSEALKGMMPGGLDGLKDLFG